MGTDLYNTTFRTDDLPWHMTAILKKLISPAPAQLLVKPPNTPPVKQPDRAILLAKNSTTVLNQNVPKTTSTLSGRNTVLTTSHLGPLKIGPTYKIGHGLAAYLSGRIQLRESRPNTDQEKTTEKRIPDRQTRKTHIRSLINKTRPIGTIDAGTGRLVIQPSDNPIVNQALATGAMREYRDGLENALKKIPGAKLAAARAAKNPRRLVEKIKMHGQPAETVSDYGAAQVSVRSPEANNSVVTAVKRTFPVLREDDQFAHGGPQYGYRCHSMQVQMTNGSSHELQIVPKEVLDANQDEHKNYKRARGAELTGIDAKGIRLRAKAQNDTAMKRFNKRNGMTIGSALSKGTTVTLPDGSQGKILYFDPNLHIARVRTYAGKNLTIRQGQLRVSPAKSEVTTYPR